MIEKSTRHLRKPGNPLAVAMAGLVMVGCGSSAQSTPTATPPTSGLAASATPRVLVVTSPPTATPSVVKEVVTATPLRVATVKTRKPAVKHETTHPRPTPIPTHRAVKRQPHPRPTVRPQAISTAVSNPTLPPKSHPVFTPHRASHHGKKVTTHPTVSPKPTLVKSAPTVVKTKPTQVKPKPTATKLKPTIVKPKPTTPKPKPTATTIRRPPTPHPTAIPHSNLPQLGPVSHQASDIRRLQADADAGTASGTAYLNPVRVVAMNLPLHGFSASFEIFPQIKVVIGYGSQFFDVYLVQPVARGTTGIWVVNRILPHRSRSNSGATGTVPPTPTGVHLGYIPRDRLRLQQIQAGANAGNPSFSYYRNPIQVVVRNLHLYGFTKPITLPPNITVVVYQRAKGYDITLTQSAKRGVSGIWLIASIRLHGAG